jgi:hypothetical protein
MKAWLLLVLAAGLGGLAAVTAASAARPVECSKCPGGSYLNASCKASQVKCKTELVTQKENSLTGKIARRLRGCLLFTKLTISRDTQG